MTRDLPNAPVNSLAVDPGQNGNPGTLYAGTDIGVFARSTDPFTLDDPVWTEVGVAPVPNSGQSSFLPNVPVTALAIFNDGFTKLLRAATYGRGVWQYVLSATPAFILSVPNPEQTLFGSQATAFSVELSSVNAYSSTVNVSCAPSTGATCSVTPTPWDWPAGNNTLTVSIPAIAPGDYSFALTAAGTDVRKITRTAALKLHVLDYQLTAPTPASASVNQGNASNTISFQVNAEGGFNAPVTLACDGLPAAATCAFSPGSTVNPLAGQPVSVTLIISTTSATPTVTSTITITASAPGTPSQMQSFSLAVVDYHLDPPSPASASVIRGVASTTTSLMLSADGDFNTPVSLACDNLPAGAACQFSPLAPITPRQGLPVTVNLTVTLPPDTPVGTVPITITASTPGGPSRTQTFSLTVTDFQITGTNPPATSLVQGNTSPAISFLVAAQGSFNETVSLSCDDLPGGASCQFSPSRSVNPTATQPVTVLLTVGSNVVTPTGTYQVSLAATTAGAPPRTQSFSLTVTARPDYEVDFSVSQLSAIAGQPAVFNGMLKSLNGYNSPVNLTCSATIPATSTCTVSAAALTPSAAGEAFTVTVSGSVAQTYTFAVNGVGTDAGAIPHSASLTLNASAPTLDFTFTTTTASQTVLAGGDGTYTLDLNPTGNAFPNAVTFSACTGLPALSTCTFNPPQVDAGSVEKQVTLTIGTTAPVLASARSSHWSETALGCFVFGLVFLGKGPRARTALRILALFVLAAAATTGCGGGSNFSGGGGQPGTPPGTYQISVTATCGQAGQAGFATHPVTVTLIVQ